MEHKLVFTTKKPIEIIHGNQVVSFKQGHEVWVDAEMSCNNQDVKMFRIYLPMRGYEPISCDFVNENLVSGLEGAR